MKKYEAIIVDDEKLAREDLSAMLKEFEQVRIIGQAESVDEAVKCMSELKPNLVFLDIQMPEKSGFELIPLLDENTDVIFVTAFDDYAIRAFEINAQDYLLKPVSTKRIGIALKNLEKTSNVKSYSKTELKENDTVFVMINNDFQFIQVESIIKISSAGNYTELITSSGHKGLVLKTMKEWEERLPDYRFIRIHRNTIVNLKYVKKVKENVNLSLLVYLEGLKEPAEMSRRYASKLKEKMG